MTEETNCLRAVGVPPSGVVVGGVGVGGVAAGVGAVAAAAPGVAPTAQHSAVGEYVWTYREPLMHLQNYTPFFRLIDFVEKTRTKRFYEPAERFEILMSACILRDAAPFCQNRRFPEDYWANLSVGPVADAFDRLITSLDIPSPQLLSQMGAQDWDTWKKKFDQAMSDIRRLAYCINMEKLADIGIYNRQTFEQRFNMQWRIKDVKLNPPKANPPKLNKMQ